MEIRALRKAANQAAFFLLVALCFATAQAGSFRVSPIRVDLSSTATSAALIVKNDGEDDVVVQLRALAWSQENGADAFTASNDILVSPPIITIPAGVEQIIRAGLRAKPDATTERAYRLFLQEVPPPPKPGFNGLQVALRVGIPVFVQPLKSPAAPALAWSLRRDKSGGPRLTLKNEGSAHVQVSDFKLFEPGKEEPFARDSLLVYVLPGQTRNWDLKTSTPVPKLPARVRLKAFTDAGEIDTEVELAEP